MPRRLKTLLFMGLLAFIPSHAFSQTSTSQVDTVLATPAGNEVNVTVGGYNYVEPGDTSISIHSPKFGGGYTGTMSFGSRQHWFVQTNARGLFGNTTYDGWCRPFLIRPDSRSPSGYALGLGDASTCGESGDKDWYLEGRALVGKDFIGQRWGWSPEAGVGVRHLSNGIADVAGFRTDDYLYLPVGMTARTLASNRMLSFSFEYDYLLRGWQTTRHSKLGGGDVPPTATAPAFTIDGFSDVSFDQHSGWALRARAKYQMTRRWSVEPEYIHWNVSDSPVNFETATFTVNRITVDQQLGAYEPLNTTDEFVVTLGFRF